MGVRLRVAVSAAKPADRNCYGRRRVRVCASV
jgi:hypothetical protein